MGRAPCCDKANVKKGPWSPEEDAKLKSYIEKHGTGGNWIALPQKIGLKRCGKSCRLRWLNYLRPNIKHGGFSEEEDSIICSLYISIGSRWSIIAAQLPGRTDNDIKNYWNTKLKKKLLGKTRREGRANRRGGGIPEREPKKLVEESFLVSNQQPPFHAPELNVPMLMDPGSQLLDNTDSIKMLLSKLGGSVDPLSFDHYHHLTGPMYNNAMISSVPSSMNTDVCNSMVAPTQPEAANWSIHSEFEEMLYYNSMKLGGIDRAYDMDNVIGSCGGGASSSESVITWENISAMAFAPHVSGNYYQGFTQLEEQCKFIEQVPLGKR